MHTALYRKKRPLNFADVVGQAPIITTLGNQLQKGHVSHAYLFCGTRGTGKTTCARIFARALNCSQIGDRGEPCNQCEICKDILAERNLNVIEIDAASNNGVDNIRDLREEVKYPPTAGSYKVYIIDEAHMLTTAAFNALLKTLEEPPSHVVFILATTEAQKIPATILSRCQRYDFKRISRNDISSTLAKYLEAEGLTAENSALEYIASVSEGALRDALSILDQCMSLYADQSISLANVQNMLGAVDLSALFAYGEALLNKDAETALHIIANASKEGRDFSRFTADIITHFRNILIASQLKDPATILDYAEETISRYKSQGSKAEATLLISFIQEFSELQNQMRYIPQERLALEVCTIKLCASLAAETSSRQPPSQPPKQALKNEHASQARQAIQAKPEPIVEPASVASTAAPTATAIPASTEAQSAIETLPPKNESDIINNWQDFCSGLNMLLKPMLSQCQVEHNGDIISLICKSSNLQYLKNQKTTIETEITKYFNLPNQADIVFKANEGYNNKEAFKENIQNKINLPVEFQ